MSDLNQYQEKILTFMNPKTMETKSDVLLNGVFGLGGESGETLDLIKKWMYHGHELDKDKLRKELGDILFYVALTAYALDTPLQEIAVGNVNKLTARYPHGFTVEDSKAKRDENVG